MTRHNKLCDGGGSKPRKKIRLRFLKQDHPRACAVDLYINFPPQLDDYFVLTFFFVLFFFSFGPLNTFAFAQWFFSIKIEINRNKWSEKKLSSTINNFVVKTRHAYIEWKPNKDKVIYIKMCGPTRRFQQWSNA